MHSRNVFQIWDSLDRITPFAVKKDNWNDKFYVVIEKIHCEELPYGNAFGYPTIDGQYSNYYISDKKWREQGIIPSAGVYGWLLVDVVIHPIVVK